MNIRNETKIGILGIVTLAILIIGYKYLKGSNIFDRSLIVFTKYRDVSQLDASAPVLVRGIKMGSVVDVRLDPNDPNMVLVALEIKKDFKLPKDAQAVLLNKLIGGKAIEIRFNDFCTDHCLKSRDTIVGHIAGTLGSMFSKDEWQDYIQVFGSELNTLLDTITDPQGNTQLSATMRNLNTTLQAISELSTQLNHVLLKSSEHLTRTFSNLDQISTALAKNSGALAQALQNVESITTSIKNSNPGMLISNANQTIAEGKKTLQDLDNTIKELNLLVEKMSSGQGSLARLVNDPELHINLEKVSRNLDLLMQDIRLHPNRYIHISVFGKKPRPYQAPTSERESK